METSCRLAISAKTRAEADRKLDSAVEQLLEPAKLGLPRGILVTKVGPGKFWVELSGDVPYGQIRETVRELEPVR